jgi:hypothetical protein
VLPVGVGWLCVAPQHPGDVGELVGVGDGVNVLDQAVLDGEGEDRRDLAVP